MRRREKFDRKVAALLGIGVLLFGAATSAQGQEKFAIGSLNTADQFISFEGFRARMAELGYRGGQNLRYQYYNSRGNDVALKTLAQKLAQDKLDLIVTSSTLATVAAAKATEAAALASYAADYSDLGSQGAVLADKILRGAPPASIPIEGPRKFKLAINLKTAKSIDLRIAKELLLRADDVID